MKDAEGVEIEVGDRILYAALAGRCAVLHRGVVLGFKESTDYYHDKPFTKVKVEIKGYEGKPKIVYLEFPERVIVVEKPSRDIQPTTEGTKEALPKK